MIAIGIQTTANKFRRTSFLENFLFWELFSWVTQMSWSVVRTMAEVIVGTETHRDRYFQAFSYENTC